MIHDESVLLNWTPLQHNQRGGKTKGQDWKRGLIIQGSGVVGGGDYLREVIVLNDTSTKGGGGNIIGGWLLFDEIWQANFGPWAIIVQ